MTTPQHRIGSGSGHGSTAAEVLDGIDLSGKFCVVTGGAPAGGRVVAVSSGHRRHRGAKLAGDLGRGESEYLSQQQRRPLRGWQRLQCRDEGEFQAFGLAVAGFRRRRCSAPAQLVAGVGLHPCRLSQRSARPGSRHDWRAVGDGQLSPGAALGDIQRRVHGGLLPAPERRRRHRPGLARPERCHRPPEAWPPRPPAYRPALAWSTLSRLAYGHRDEAGPAGLVILTNS